jgi:hypothetical protein
MNLFIPKLNSVFDIPKIPFFCINSRLLLSTTAAKEVNKMVMINICRFIFCLNQFLLLPSGGIAIYGADNRRALLIVFGFVVICWKNVKISE